MKHVLVRKLVPGVVLAGFLVLVPMAAARHPDGTLLQRHAVQVDADASDAVKRIADAVALERIVYTSDGLEVEGYLARPGGEIATPLPCLIYLRGGNRNFGALDERRAFRLLGRIAARGYVVAATQYRGNGRHGTQTYPGVRTCEGCEQAVGGVGREEFGGVDVHDVLALLPLLDAIEAADTSRIGLYGWSRGGMMTYLTLKTSDRFDAAIVGAGVADAVAGFAQRPDMAAHVYAELIPGWDDPERRRAALEARSAVLWADELPSETPLLLLHGSGDWRVDPTQALDMARALLAAQRPYRLVIFEGGDHGLSEYRSEVDSLVDQWLDRYVRDGERWPSLKPHGR